MSVIASSLVNWSALGKIVVVALIGGAGVVIAFGLLLLGLKWATAAKRGSAKLGGVTLAGLSALFCTAAVVFGIYAMADKPSSKKPARKTAVVLTHAPARSAELGGQLTTRHRSSG
jgi:hypothetical protein